MAKKKKSNAQIARMMKRAAARGEEYIPPTTSSGNTDQHHENAPTITDESTARHREHDDDDSSSPEEIQNKKKAMAAYKMLKILKDLEHNPDQMRAKERRSAKRRAEAIALEESGCSSTDELRLWYEEHGETYKSHIERTKETATLAVVKQSPKTKSEEGSSRISRASTEGNTKSRKQNNPYIVFVGQLAYTTTKEALFAHLKAHLPDQTVTADTIRIRLLTDAKSGKSRGMAFLETTDPELLYATLKLHHTLLDGRRINIERSAGGGSNNKKRKVEQYRKDQQDYLSETVDQMLAEYQASGELQPNELDEGAVLLCKRHAPSTVEMALTKYLDTNGRDMDNPSAYFTHLVGKLAEEGPNAQESKSQQRDDNNSNKRSSRDRSTTSSRPSTKRRKEEPATTPKGTMGHNLKNVSDFAKEGVDMSLSMATKPQTKPDSNNDNMSKIFPSMRSRGRGGRGYMR